jgi:hypothetical protein
MTQPVVTVSSTLPVHGVPAHHGAPAHHGGVAVHTGYPPTHGIPPGYKLDKHGKLKAIKHGKDKKDKKKHH